jgi:hypothetical protein
MLGICDTFSKATFATITKRELICPWKRTRQRLVRFSLVRLEKSFRFRKSVDSITVTNVKRPNSIPEPKSARSFEASGLDQFSSQHENGSTFFRVESPSTTITFHLFLGRFHKFPCRQILAKHKLMIGQVSFHDFDGRVLTTNGLEINFWNLGKIILIVEIPNHSCMREYWSC